MSVIILGCLVCQDTGEGDDGACPECCDHQSSGFDHGICIDCGYEKDPGEDIDEAEYHWDTER